MEGSQENPVVLGDSCPGRRRSTRIKQCAEATAAAEASNSATTTRATVSRQVETTNTSATKGKRKQKEAPAKAVKKESDIQKRVKTDPDTPKKKVKKERAPRTQTTPRVQTAPRAQATRRVQAAPREGAAEDIQSLATDEEKVILNKLRGKIERARGQRMFVVSRELLYPHSQSFGVLGSTGNVYTVIIGTQISCDCKDFFYGYRHAGPRHCKHILMVLIKVFRLEPTSKAYRSLKLSMKLVDEIFSRNAIPDPSAIASEAIQTAVSAKLYGEINDEEGAKRRPLDTSDCPICFEEFTEEAIATILFCKTCGNNVHKVCFEAWKKSSRSRPTCVYCRTEWADKVNKKYKSAALNKEGYLNVAKEANISTKRDTSTYRQFPGASVRRRP